MNAHILNVKKNIDISGKFLVMLLDLKI
jgi:hypothetical protein